MSATVLMDNILLDACLGAAATLLGGSVDIGLSTTAINKDGTGYTEPAGGGYARQTVLNNGTNFGVASGSEKSNLIVIDFGSASADWGTIIEWFLIDVGSGAVRFHGILDDGVGAPQSRPVYDGDNFKFLANALRIKMI